MKDINDIKYDDIIDVYHNGKLIVTTNLETLYQHMKMIKEIDFNKIIISQFRDVMGLTEVGEKVELRKFYDTPDGRIQLLHNDEIIIESNFNDIFEDLKKMDEAYYYCAQDDEYFSELQLIKGNCQYCGGNVELKEKK